MCSLAIQKRKEKRMELVKKLLLSFSILLVIFIQPIYATETEVLESQKNSLNISDFIRQAQNYTKDTFQDMDFNQLLESAMTGTVDNNGIYKSIISLLGTETKNTLKTFRSDFGSDSDS